MQRYRSIPCGLALSGCLTTGVAAAQSATPSQIPSSGDAVKGSDVIIWQVHKPITLAGDGSASSSSAGTGANGPTAAEKQAAAQQVDTAAHNQLIASIPAPGATAEASNKYKAVSAAAQQADNELVIAKAAAQDVAAAAAKDGSSGSAGNQLTDLGERKAAAQIVDKARTDLQKSVSDKEAAVNAKESASKLQDATAAVDKAHAYYAATLQALETLSTTAPSAARAVCFPSRSRFNVTSVTAASKPSTSGSATTTAANTQLVAGHFSSSLIYKIVHPAHGPAIPREYQVRTPTPCGDAAPVPAKLDTTYEFSADQLAKSDFYREGLTWGGLVVPYKFYFTDHTIKSNSSALAFIGYEGWIPGVSLSTIIGVGFGTTPSTSNSSTTGTAATSSSSTSTSTVVTFSAGAGWVATFGGTFKAGLMFGRDYQGKSGNFPYENKWWMGLSLGAGF